MSRLGLVTSSVSMPIEIAETDVVSGTMMAERE
jgi:hypothetical protein